MDKYKKIVLKILRIYGSDFLGYLHDARNNPYDIMFTMELAMSSYKKYKQYKIIPESAIKGWHGEWL